MTKPKTESELVVNETTDSAAMDVFVVRNDEEIAFVDKFTQFSRLIRIIDSLFFGPKLTDSCDQLTKAVDYLFTESFNESICEKLVTDALESMAKLVRLSDIQERVPKIIEQRLSKFFDDCLIQLFEDNVADSVTYRITAALKAIMAASKINGLVLEPIVKICEKLRALIDDYEKSRSRSRDIIAMSTLVQSLAVIVVEWLERKEQPFAHKWHNNWIVEKYCKKEMMTTNQLMDKIYGDIEWSVIHTEDIPVFGQLMFDLQEVLKKYHNYLKKQILDHCAFNNFIKYS